MIPSPSSTKIVGKKPEYGVDILGVVFVYQYFEIVGRCKHFAGSVFRAREYQDTREWK